MAEREAEIDCPNCGEAVYVEDLGDNPTYLSGQCEKCGKSWSYNPLSGEIDEE